MSRKAERAGEAESRALVRGDRSARAAERLAHVLLAGLGIVAASAAAVWPLWALATARKSLFNALMGGLALALLAFAAARRLGARRRAAGRRGAKVRGAKVRGAKVNGVKDNGDQLRDAGLGESPAPRP